jgi:hypothetical protein
MILALLGWKRVLGLLAAELGDMPEQYWDDTVMNVLSQGCFCWFLVKSQGCFMFFGIESHGCGKLLPIKSFGCASEIVFGPF